ncbi:MAG: hypothetical protein ACJ739_05575 [Acidimicrobiales bacterium]
MDTGAMGSSTATATDLDLARWRGQEGRVEVWYATLTDRHTGTGVWIHHETVAPTGEGQPYAHGWAAVFEPGVAPVVERFGPVDASATGDARHVVGGCELAPGCLRGSAGALQWDLTYVDAGPPLFTFPRVAWGRELLPGAQIVPAPDATFTGSIAISGRAMPVAGCGALARIYGHGSAQRWGWLHADLDGEGTLEIVTATARRAALRRLPPLALVQLRLPGRPDWPARPLLAAPRFRTRLRPDGFEVRGRAAGARLTVRVELPANESVSLQYDDPDGETATCTNSERASATIRFEEGDAARTWDLDGIAHAEVGRRP